MSFARWKTKIECEEEQKSIGHNEDAAKTICGLVQQRVNTETLFKTASKLDILKAKNGDLIIGGPASWEMIDQDTPPDYITTGAMVNFLRKFFALPPEYRNISIDHHSLIMGKALLQYPQDNPQYFSHVHEKGMYLIAKIRNDSLSYTKEYRQKILDGDYKMYSIRGKPLKFETTLMDKQLVRKIYDIDPIEVAIVREGMNPKAGPLAVLQKVGVPKTDEERLIAHFGEEKAQKLIELVGLEVAVKLLPERGQRVEKLSKTVERRGDKWCVIHCHGPDTGKPIKCFDTEAEAQAMHRAIQANKGLDKQDGRPPKVWMDNCMGRAQSFADDPGAFCNDLWHNGPPEKREAFGKSLTKLPFQQEVEKIFRKHFPNYKGD